MLELHVSTSLDDLADLLAANLRAAARTLFDPTTIVVPNAVLGTFVQLGLARRLGIAANIDFPFLTPFFSSLIPEADREKVRLLDREVLQSLLISLLSDAKLLDRNELAPVRDYLHAAGDEPDVVDRRRVQLAAQIARVFEDYALTRPDLLDAWKKKPTLPKQSTQSTTELWERALWLEIQGRGDTWITLPALLARYKPAELSVPAELHVFGFTHFAPVYMKLLHGLAERSTIHVYTFTPCAEETTGLARFGEPSFEHLAVWKDLGVEPTTKKVAPLAAKPIKVLACPSVAREVEAVAGDIWELVTTGEKSGNKLRFNEIAILLAGREQDAYRSQIAATLPRAYKIPVSSAALFRAQESRALEAVRLLLELPLGTFKRAELLRLMTHPNVLALVPDVEVQTWLDWCDELEILGGADRADLADTYVERDLQNWDQGLKRLALGAFLSGERSRDASLVRVGADDYLPLDTAQDELSSAASFALLARSLLADALAARKGQHTLKQWAAFLQQLVASYLAATEDDDERLLGIASSKLRRLEDLDLDGRPVSYRVAFELAIRRLESLGETRGHDLSGGVVVAPLLPGRPIPFKAVFVVGLGEGGFPASARADLLDLKGEHRPGDLNAQERDRLTFLEVFAAATDRVTLSYVARDATTGEKLAPSSLIREVEGHFRPNVTYSEHALRRFHADYFAKPLGGAAATRASVPEAIREAQVRALREHRNAPPSDERASAVLAALAEGPRATLADLLGVCEPHEGTKRAPDTIRISIHELCDFLMSPLQAWAQRRLRLDRDDEEVDVLLREEELFAPTKLTRTIFLREVFFDALRRKETLAVALAAAHDERTRSGDLSGELPTGVFLEVTKRDHQKVLSKWHGNLVRLLEEKELRSLEAHRFGASDDFGESDLLHRPVVIELEKPCKIRVEVTGRTNRILPGASGSVLLVPKEELDEKHTLRGFLDHALLAAAGVECAEKRFRVITIPAVHPGGFDPEQPFVPFTTEEARKWLTDLLEDYLGERHDYLLAYEPVLEFLRDGDPENPLFDKILWWRDKSYKKKPADAWGPVKNWQDYDPPADAEAKAVRRLWPYVKRAQGEE